MSGVLIGVCDAAIPEGTETSWDLNKVGGKPDLMVREETVPGCGKCSRQMHLVVQVYCPVGISYRRTIYVFACSNSSCWNHNCSWKALRCQVPDPAAQVREVSMATNGGTHEQQSMEGEPEFWGGMADDWGDKDHVMSDDVISMLVGEPCGQHTGQTSDPYRQNTGLTSDEDSTAESGTSQSDDNQPYNQGVIPPPTGHEELTEQLNIASFSMYDGSAMTECKKCDSQPVMSPSADHEELTEQLNIASFSMCDGSSATECKMSDSQLDSCIPETLNCDIPFESILSQLMNPDRVSTGKGDSARRDGDLCSFYINVFEEEHDNIFSLEHEKELLEKYVIEEGTDAGDLSTKLQKLGKQSGKTGKTSDGQKQPVKTSKASDGSESYEKTMAKHGDSIFYKFQKQISSCPEQILRYDYKGEPLYIQTPVVTDPGPCKHCGGSVLFEFQLMPALVNILRFPGEKEPAMEFGTVLVYTCASNCWEDRGPAREEITVIQTDPDHNYFNKSTG